jgi:peptidoglycan pentaglycine glycine transferase (the first glycine)
MNFASSLEDYVIIYLYRYNAEKDIIYTENIIHEVENQLKRINDEISDPVTTDKKRERLEPKKKEAEKQLNATKKRQETTKMHIDNPYVSASFYIKMGNKAYNFYGANAAALRDLKLTANYWDMIEDSLDGRIETFNMGGTLKMDTDDIKKDKMYELYQYKCQYNGEFSQFPGEYFLIFNKKLFNLLNNKLNYFRRIIFKF